LNPLKPLPALARSWTASPRVRRTLAITLFLASLVPAAIGLVHWGVGLQRPGYTNFGDYYLDARIGVHDGWSSLYDLKVEEREWQALGGAAVLPMFPVIYPPPLAWLVAPFSLLPFPIAFVLWATLMLGLFLWIWTMIAPGSRLQRWTLLAAAIGTSPVSFGLLLAHVLIGILAGVTAAWWLLQRRREVLAGLALLVLAIRPQAAILVPFALLVAGYRRAFIVWAAAMAVIAGVAMASVGPSGVHTYVDRLQAAAGNGGADYMVASSLSIAAILGHGWLAAGAQGILILVTLVAAYRHRRLGPELPMVAGLIGSLLVTPFIHLEDLTTVVVAAWLYLRTRPPIEGRIHLVLGYALLAPSILFRFGLGTEPFFLCWEVAWLLLIAWLPHRPGVITKTEPLATAA
jgi:hypothetical protein